MPEYAFTAQDKNGKLVKGKRTAKSSVSLADALGKEGIIPINITEAAKAKTIDFKLPSFFKRRIKPEELQLFCRQMHTLIKTGIPINIAVTRLIQTTKDKTFKKILESILVDLNAGRTLESALIKFPEAFSTLFINIIKVGEATGQLDTVFLQLSDYLALEVETKQKIKEAMRYPAIVLTALSVALIVLNILVIPTFVKMFERFKTTLPLPTRILINTSWFFTTYWPYLLIATFVLFGGVRWYVSTDTGRIKWHRLLLKLPIIGWLVHRIYLSRFAKLFALMTRAGISVVDTMALVGEATGNAYLASKITVMTNYIARGNSVLSACVETKFFPPLVLQMISLGEETGRLDEMLQEVSIFYDREIDYDSKRMADLIEPIILVIMAVMVLILALGIFLPMWDMMSTVHS